MKEETAIEQLHAREQVTTDRAHKAQRVRDPEQTLHNLLQAALVVFGRDGYERATVDEIVHVAGCSKGAFYNHFSSKEELFLQLLERRIDGNHERFMEVCQWEGDAPKWLRRVFETIVRFSERDPNWRALSVEFMAHGMRNAEIGQRIATMHQQARQFIAAPLRESEEFRSGRMAVNPDTVAACMVALIDGFLIHASMEPQELPIEQLGQRLQPLLQAWFPGQQRQ